MDACAMIKERRSVRNYQDKKVNREIMKEVVELSSWAPSWANFQVARYTLVEESLLGYNKEKLKSAKGLVIRSYVKGECDSMKSKFLTSKGAVWEVLDAGIAAHTFCLGAYAKGIATCMV